MPAAVARFDLPFPAALLVLPEVDAPNALNAGFLGNPTGAERKEVERGDGASGFAGREAEMGKPSRAAVAVPLETGRVEGVDDFGGIAGAEVDAAG